MIRFIVVSVVNGIVFGMLDGLIHANPYAQKLFKVYQPIAKTSINVPAGIVIDLLYGFIMGAVFLLLYNSLPGNAGWVKGLAYGLIIWFFRVFMGAVSSWMMYEVPLSTLLYMAVAGFLKMLMIGLVYGLFLKPFAW